MNVPIVRAVADLRTIVAGWRREAASIAVVPTMGALHEGHLSLVRAALEKADRVIVTLFVNPKQFNSAADLAAYPRTEVEDAAKLAPLGAHLLYAPDAAEIYPEGFATAVSVGGVSEGLCGAFRPGHFDGVATVVTRLFNAVQPDVVVLGSKDFQQLLTIRYLVRDLAMPIRIVAAPTRREPDGLAMSSRNQYLSAGERAVAPVIYRTLRGMRDAIRSGQEPGQVEAEALAGSNISALRQIVSIASCARSSANAALAPRRNR